MTAACIVSAMRGSVGAECPAAAEPEFWRYPSRFVRTLR
jgi:hypothetical protein